MGQLDVRLAQHALARHFNYFSQTVVPNVYCAGGEMDLAVVTRAGYLVEVEIKASLADWNADRAKSKWQMPKEREKVSRFYYAVPTDLLGRRPGWVPAQAGLIELRWIAGSKGYWCNEHTKAVRASAAQPISYAEHNALLNSTYHRFWQRELRAA